MLNTIHTKLSIFTLLCFSIMYWLIVGAQCQTCPKILFLNTGILLFFYWLMVLKYNLKPHIWLNYVASMSNALGQNIKCGKYLCKDFCLSLIILQLILLYLMFFAHGIKTKIFGANFRKVMIKQWKSERILYFFHFPINSFKNRLT